MFWARGSFVDCELRLLRTVANAADEVVVSAMQSWGAWTPQLEAPRKPSPAGTEHFNPNQMVAASTRGWIQSTEIRQTRSNVEVGLRHVDAVEVDTAREWLSRCSNRFCSLVQLASRVISSLMVANRLKGSVPVVRTPGSGPRSDPRTSPMEIGFRDAIRSVDIERSAAGSVERLRGIQCREYRLSGELLSEADSIGRTTWAQPTKDVSGRLRTHWTMILPRLIELSPEHRSGST